MNKARNKEFRDFLKKKFTEIEERNHDDKEPEEQRFNRNGVDVSF